MRIAVFFWPKLGPSGLNSGACTARSQLKEEETFARVSTDTNIILMTVASITAQHKTQVLTVTLFVRSMWLYFKKTRNKSFLSFHFSLYQKLIDIDYHF